MPASSRSAPPGMEIAGIYLPNGNSGGEDGYAYKLRWMERLGDWVQARLDAFAPVAVLGDFNVCPTDADLAPGALPPTDALVRPETPRPVPRPDCMLGMTDALAGAAPAGRTLHLLGLRPGFRDRTAGSASTISCSARNWRSGWSNAVWTPPPGPRSSRATTRRSGANLR